MSESEEDLVHRNVVAALSADLCLAFADRSYTIMIGNKQKPPLLELGWYRWWPTSLSFARLSRPRL
jgi:hypothetical protein